jgi:acyl carrier protein
MNEWIHAVSEQLAEVLKHKNVNQAVIDDKTAIFGSGSIIDSLDLVGMIVALEEQIQKATGKEVTLVDESSLIAEPSPFGTVGSLATLISQKLHGL